jgi:zinc transport system permease protein
MALEILEYSFMQRALIAGIAVAIICSLIGLFLVLRRHSLFGDALSHMAFGGIAIGMYINVYPIWTAFIVSILAALGITKLRQSTNIPPDSSVAVLLSSGLALGVVLVNLSNGFSIDLFSFLFGSILLISIEDTLMILAIAVTIISIVLIFYRKLMYITFDEEQAKVSGLQVTKLNYLFIVLAGITVIASMRLVGILLISSLIVIPTITAIMFGKGFKKTTLISVSISVLCVVTGIILSYMLNLAPGGTIVIVSVGVFIATLTTKYFIKKAKRVKNLVLESRSYRR